MLIGYIVEVFLLSLSMVDCFARHYLFTSVQKAWHHYYTEKIRSPKDQSNNVLRPSVTDNLVMYDR